MRRHVLATALVTIVLTSSPSTAVAQPADRCADILRYGVFDQSYLNATKKDYRLFQHTACSNKSEESRKSLAQSFQYLTPTESYAGAWNASSDDQKRELVCSNQIEETFTHDSIEIFVSKASKTIVDAWESCMTAESGRQQFSARYSEDLKDVTLRVDSGVRDLRLGFFGKNWRKQIQVTPRNAIVSCDRAFATDQTRDTISCVRNIKRLNERVTIQLLAKYGGQPEIELPRAPRQLAEVPLIEKNVYLSKGLEIGGNTFQAIVYEPWTNNRSTPFHNFVRLYSQNASPSVVTYRIPPGARSFSATVGAYAATCDRSDINGWTIVVRVPGGESKGGGFHWTSDPVSLEIPLDTIPPEYPRLLLISVEPGGDRTCDHPGLGDPHFSPNPVANVARAAK